jgi:hypothetical protein
MSKPEEQAVLVYLDGASLPDSVYERFDLATLEDQLTAVINDKHLGEYDGNEFGRRERHSLCMDRMPRPYSTALKRCFVRIHYVRNRESSCGREARAHRQLK